MNVEQCIFFRQKVSPALLPEQSVQKSSRVLGQRTGRARTTRRLKIRATHDSSRQSNERQDIYLRKQGLTPSLIRSAGDLLGQSRRDTPKLDPSIAPKLGNQTCCKKERAADIHNKKCTRMLKVKRNKKNLSSESNKGITFCNRFIDRVSFQKLILLHL